MEKYKNLLLIIWVSILVIVHAWIIKPQPQVVQEKNRYEVVSLNDSNYLLIDHEENKIYQRYVSPNNGPTEFRELVLPE